MKIVCLGDSFTRGYGVDERHNWVSCFRRSVDGAVLNLGVNGDTTGGMLARFYPDVVETHPRYVMIDGGFNDFLAGAGREVAQANLMALVHQAYHNSIVPILLICPGGNPVQFMENWPSFVPIREIGETFAAYRKWILGFCEAFSVFYIDIYGYTDYDNFREHCYLDGIHLNETGHQMVSEMVLQQFEKMIGI